MGVVGVMMTLKRILTSSSFFFLVISAKLLRSRCFMREMQNLANRYLLRVFYSVSSFLLRLTDYTDYRRTARSNVACFSALVSAKQASSPFNERVERLLYRLYVRERGTKSFVRINSI